MAKSDLKKKQDEVNKIPVGSGMVDKTKTTIRNRQKELDNKLEGLFKNDKKKKNK